VTPPATGKTPDTYDLPAGLVEEALNLYTNLPYHNQHHAKTVTEHARELAFRALREGLDVNLTQITLAALLHDSGYEHAPKTITREQHSANLTAKLLQKWGYTEHIQAVQEIILATEKGTPPKTLEQQIVRAADLKDIGGAWETFKTNSINLKEEAEYLSGKQITQGAWNTGTCQIIGYYLSQDINITSGYYDTDGTSTWHRQAANNLARYVGENH
jgi:predicted metal-dependent HD superfamily phosphohydrolase